MPTLTSSDAYENTYNSLSGVDIKAVFHNKAALPLQAISYAVQREKAPIYTLGHPDPRAYSRGKRGIAGTLIFAVFDSHALVGVQGIFSSSKFAADKEEIRPSTGASNTIIDSSIVGVTDGLNPGGEGDSTIAGDDQESATPWYSDQIPPFDVVLTGANELGTLMIMRVLGVEILNEGYGISIDDLMSEMQMTYVARGIVPWTRLSGGLRDTDGNIGHY